jgi:hypothetical protein
MAQLLARQDGSQAGRSAGRPARRRAAAVRAVALAAVAVAGLATAAAEEPHHVGGCHTVEREFGLPALRDSLAIRAFGELTAPGSGPKTGPACRQLAVDAPLFVTIGAVTEPADSTWVRIASHVTARMLRCEIRLATRSSLRCTSGTCFPPYHVEFEAVGDSTQVGEFLKELTGGSWDPLVITPRRAERTLFVAAGVSRETLDTVVDLKLR